MTSIPEGLAFTADPASANDYDSIAEGYTAENETSLLNAYYERPAMLELAGDVANRRILDAGCGAGPLFAALRDRGAAVTGIDASTGMLELARRRLGADADLRVANLAWDRPLHAMTDAFTAAGFRINVISEPPPAPAARDLFPEVFRELTSTSFLGFLFFVLQAS